MNFRMDPPPAVIRQRKREATDNDSQLTAESRQSSVDSARAVAPRSRRKRPRTFLHAFNAITLQRPEGGDAGAGGEDDAEDDDDDADSSRAVADEGDECNNSVTSSLEDDLSQEDRLLSDREEAERKVMLELVFGPDRERKNVVDAKLEGMIRNTMQRAAKMQSMDDMDLDTSYQRSNDASTDSSFSSYMKRSSSLPNMLEDTMDLDM